MAIRADITPELCRQLFRYEPDSGKLFWRDVFLPNALGLTAHNFHGKEVGKGSGGYREACIDGVSLKAHVIIWAMAYGEWPADRIDHRDRVRGNNRLRNLRVVTHQRNLRNAARSRNNKSGVNGVHWCKAHRKWVAGIRVDGKIKTLGRFSTLEEAARVRRNADAKFGYDPNHGTPVIR